MALPMPGAPGELSDTGSAPSSIPSASTSASSSLLDKVKRRISIRKNSSSSSNSTLGSLRDRLPQRLGGSSSSSRAEGLDDGDAGPVLADELRAYTIAPPDHRENTALHAIMDSLPSFGSLHPPTIGSVNPLRATGGVGCFGPEGYDSEDDASPPATPPEVRSNPASRRPSTAHPSLPRRSSDPESQPRRPSDPCAAGANPRPSTSSSQDALADLYGNVVMLGGYRGSVLRDAKTHKRIWLPLKVGFGIRKVDLGLGLDEEDEIKSEDKVIPGNMLTAIGGWIDLGRKLKDRLKQLSASQLHPSHGSFPFVSSSVPTTTDPLHPPLRFHSFGYDWRRSLQLSSALLLEKLQRLKEESALRGEGPDGKGLGATIIAHSMGGLVALHALASAPDPTIVRGILFAGTPFQGCINTLGPLRLGGGVAFNQKIGSPETVFSGMDFSHPDDCAASIAEAKARELARSASRRSQGHEPVPTVGAPGSMGEQSLPGQEEALRAGELLSQTLADVAERMGQAEGGDAAAQGEVEILKRQAMGITSVKKYLDSTLRRAKEFQEDLVRLYDPAKAHLYPPIAVLTSSRTPTVRGVLVTDREHIAAEGYDRLLWAAGDGIVLHESATRLPGDPEVEGRARTGKPETDRWMYHLQGTVESSHGHIGLLGDLDGVKKGLELLYG
ncbi:hypothetical protein Rhopal_006883-T1 [Rhodotorula paludigena]|uniref:GPI inositol-deacylase n=1 Tax=Rhodotorula paludigena TaxID=86838 RepID=A0AAV5GWH2_9BASI|nr:hypothetical protein Rhopal_006883-T1 [Rhodotorula paludigena]